MALHSRNHRHEEEEESAFVSMTDLMISILFIIMILMAFFANRLVVEETVPKSVYEQKVAEVILLRRHVDDLNQQIAWLLVNIEELTNEVTLLEGELRISNELLDKYRNEIDVLEQQIKRMRQDTKDLARTLAEFESAIEILRIENQALTEDNLDLRVQLKLKDEIIVGSGGSMAEFAALKALLKDLREQLAIKERRIRELEKILQKDASLATVLDSISKTRNGILQSIALRLRSEGIIVEVDPVSGILRFDENSIKFEKGKSTPSISVRKIMEHVSQVLEEELRCFTLGKHSVINVSCNPTFAIVETVQIEGHTDSEGGFHYNLGLSMRRAAETYKVFVNSSSKLLDYLNANGLISPEISGGIETVGQPVLSVSGYGESRPIQLNGTTEGEAANRRIDLRFIMSTPKSLDESVRLREAIKRALSSDEG